MGLSESTLNHTIQCVENICEEVDCEIKSCCCETRYSNSSPKRTKSKESNNNHNEKYISKHQIRILTEKN